MDIKILHSWLLEYLDTDVSAIEIGRCLALCGPSVEKVEKYGKNDWLYSIEVTTNRVDMMSVYGIAREASAILPQLGHKAKLKPLSICRDALQCVSTKQLPLTIKTKPSLTNRVLAQVLDVGNADLHSLPQTPQWMKNRLEAADIRSLNLLIDITNYVMLETGQPCHVFDYDRIKTHKLIFRESKKGEKITTLDNKTYILHGDDSVIDDGDGEIIDLPGIMGTANSVVTDKTKTIIFFIDNNNGQLMRKTSMQHGIRTNAVAINEKGVSPELSAIAMKRGTDLYQQLCGAKPAHKLIDIYDNKPKEKSISASLQFIEDRIGVKLDPKFVTKTLENLGFSTKLTKLKGVNNLQPTTYNLQLTIPYWRLNDIDIPEDIVEEVARIYGYHNLPSTLPTGKLPQPNPIQAQFYWEQKVKNALKYYGYLENYTYSLVSQELLDKFNLMSENHLKLKNPLNLDWLYLRTTLVPSLINSIVNNQDNAENLKLFELANIYLPRKNDLPQENLTLTLVNSGSDFFKLKGELEVLANDLGLTFDWRENQTEDYLEKEIQAEILVNNEKVGVIGQINNNIQQAFNLKQKVLVCQINFAKLVKYATKNKIYISIPKYPPIIERLTFFNQVQKPAAEILKAVNNLDNLINKIEIADVFEDKLSLEITYLDPKKNLTDKEVAPLRQKIVATIEKLRLQLQGEI